MPQKTNPLQRNSVYVPDEIIRYNSDFQLPWQSLINPLHQGRFVVEHRSMHGDAPKAFLRVREYTKGWRPNDTRTWPGYIAKVGSKWYPIESITEHLVTRIGQTCGVHIAESQLRIVGNQVRFLSRFFLDEQRERLSHGLDLFRVLLDDETVDKIAADKNEREFYTFEMVQSMFDREFTTQSQRLMNGFVSLLGFDAFCGNNDRHPMNWGVIVPIGSKGSIRFAPIFDSARALFWNVPERKVNRMLTDDKLLTYYVNRSQPQIGWTNWQSQAGEKFDHFTLVKLIVQYFPQYRPQFDRFIVHDLIERCEEAVEKEFSPLLSSNRRKLIVKCLKQRQKLLAQALL